MIGQTIRPAYRPFLDQVRWVSALIVAVGHALALLNSRADGSPILNLIADMRGPAVYIFFVLSGYLVGGVVVKDWEKFQLLPYAIARFSRIYAVLIPALVLTACLDGIAIHVLPHNPLYSGMWQGGALADEPVAARYTPLDVVTSVASLEPLFATPIGSAGSLWSLGYEWIFYFALPLLYIIGYRIRGLLGAHLIVAVSVAGVYWVTKIGAAFWMIWLLGAYASKVRMSAVIANHAVEAVIQAIALLGIVVFLIVGANLPHQLTIAAMGGLGFMFLSGRSLWEQKLHTKYDHALAGMSYSLYVTHLPCLTLIAAWLYSTGHLPSNGIESPVQVITLAFASLGVVLVLAFVFGRTFESRTTAFTCWLKSVLIPNRT